MASTAELVRDHWARLNARPRPGASTADLSAFEMAYGCALPQPVDTFYRTVNGMLMDNEVFEAWPIADIGPVPLTVASYRGCPDYGAIVQTLPDANDYFAFGDCMAFSQVLAVRLRPPQLGTPVIWISGPDFVRVASTFEEFWRRYLADSRTVLWP